MSGIILQEKNGTPETASDEEEPSTKEIQENQ